MRVALALLLALGAPAAAQTPAPGVSWPDCYCTDSRGARVEIGERACLVINGRAMLARCDKALNVTIWRETGEGCVSARAQRGAGGVEPPLQPGAVDAEIVTPEAQS
jgi:hypothetical protein